MMADYIKRIRTNSGDKQLDWDAIGNPPAVENEYKENTNPISGLGVKDAVKKLAPNENTITYDDIDTTFASGVYLVDGRDRSVGDGKCEVMVVSSAERGVGQFYFYDDGRLAYRNGSDGKWYSSFIELIDVVKPIATKEYVDSAIGDIETSLENIIAKYGLGGDEV